MPGVIVETSTQPGATGLVEPVGATFFVAGLAERGDSVNPIEVRSMAEYAQKLGGRVSYGALYDALTLFFSEGGSRALVARVVGAGATLGTLMLADRAGTPANTVRLDAKNAGAWSTQVTVEVLDGVLADTFTVLVRLNGVLVEQYRDQANPTDFVAALNARSALLTATNMGSATAAPSNNPAVLAATALSAGDDNRAAVNAAALVAALARFSPELGTGAVAIPGQAASAVGSGLQAHALAHGRIALLAPALNSNIAAAKAEADPLRDDVDGSSSGFFYQWLTIPDGAGGTRTVSPEAFVAAKRSEAIRLAGPWRAPAAAQGRSRYAIAATPKVTRAELDDLANSRINAFRDFGGEVRLYGWRSLSIDAQNFLFLSARDTLNYIAQVAEAVLEEYVAETVDGSGRFLGRLEGEIRGVLEPIRADGGLFELDDEGYSVDVSEAVNTAEVLAAGEVRAVVGVRISPIAETIRLYLSKVPVGASL